MVFTSSVDRYDELRREWIAEHAGIFSMQIRRAELLNRRIRRRTRDVAGARPSPYNDHPSHPLMTRGVKTVEGVLEVSIVIAAAILAPIGWPLGKLIYHRSEALIPGRLRSYPIPAFLWSAVALGALLVLLYRPADTLTNTVVAPWLLAQLPAAALTAGIYGILNGWLAIDGSTDWWPLAPTAPTVTLTLPLLPDDMTAPSPFRTIEPADPIDRTPLGAGAVRPMPRSGKLIVVGLILNAAGIVWTLAAVGVGIKTFAEQAFTPSSTIGSSY